MTDQPRIPGVAGVCGVRADEHDAESHLYPCGWRCALHTPNAMAGRPEPPPRPGWPSHRRPPHGADPEAAVPTSTEHRQDETR